MVAEHLGDVPRRCIPGKIYPTLIFVLIDEAAQHAKHLPGVFAWAIEVGHLILGELECGSHYQAAL